MARPTVAIIGAGPAGLAAAEYLADRAGNKVDITLYHAGHHYGGKAASWRDLKGNEVDHGFHICFGFYREMMALMERSGVNLSDVLESNAHKYYYLRDETASVMGFTRANNFLRFGANLYRASMLPFFDQLNFGRFMFYCLLLANSGDDLTQYDDRCFTAFALENGLKERSTYNSIFRFFRQAYFNWPEEISAYHVLQTLRVFRKREDSEMFNFKRPLSEAIWEPIVGRLKKLGVKVQGMNHWLGLKAELANAGGIVTELSLATPDARRHSVEQKWHTHVIADKKTEFKIKPDYVIAAIPCEELKYILLNNEKQLSDFAPFSFLRELNSGETIGATIETKNPVGKYRIPTLAGLRGPMHTICDLKPFFKPYANKDVASAITLVGQPGEFSGWSDDEILRATIAEIERIEHVNPSSEWQITRTEIHRNTSRHEKLFLCEPGVNKFRPTNKTHFKNLFVAGDWVRNPIDLVCMEGAIQSGQLAAQHVGRALQGQS